MADDLPTPIPISDTEGARQDASKNLKSAQEFIVLTTDDGETWKIEAAWSDYTRAYGAAMRYFTRAEFGEMFERNLEP